MIIADYVTLLMLILADERSRQKTSRRDGDIFFFDAAYVAEFT